MHDFIYSLGEIVFGVMVFLALGAIYMFFEKLLEFCHERYREVKLNRISGDYCIDISKKSGGKKPEFHNHKTALIELNTTGFYPTWKFLEIDGEPVKHEDWEGFRYMKEKLEDFED